MFRQSWIIDAQWDQWLLQCTLRPIASAVHTEIETNLYWVVKLHACIYLVMMMTVVSEFQQSD